MPDKVAFATSNWKDKPDKPSQMTQGEWDAYNSSKFNGFPFPTLEKDQENNTFSDWDLETTYAGMPSKSSENLVSVLSPGYSYKFTFDQLFQVFWRMSHAKPEIKNANDVTSTNNRFSLYTYDSSTSTITEYSKYALKDKESELITRLDENKWVFYINECTVAIDFTLPVLKTGDDEYRVYISCDCCAVEPMIITYSYSNDPLLGKGWDECPNAEPCGGPGTAGSCAGATIDGFLYSRAWNYIPPGKTPKAKIYAGASFDNWGNIGSAFSDNRGTNACIAGSTSSDVIDTAILEDKKMKIAFSATNALHGGPYGVMDATIEWYWE